MEEDTPIPQESVSIEDRIEAKLNPVVEETEETTTEETQAVAEEPAEDTPETESPQEETETVTAEAETESEEAPQEATEDEYEKLTTLAELGEALEDEGYDYSELLKMSVPVKVQGENESVPLEEVIRRYQGEATLTRRSQELADERRSFEEERETLSGSLNEKVKQAEEATQLAQAMLLGKYASYDWEKLAAEDPVQYQEDYADAQRIASQIQATQNRLDSLRKEGEEKVQADLQEHLKNELNLLVEKVRPSWADEKVARKEMGELRDYAISKGFTDEEFASIGDHRLYAILFDAAGYSKVESAKPRIKKKIRKAPKMGKGKRTSAAPADESQKARAKLKQSGKVSDAVDVILNRLG